jgi:tetratricopeptide (TPR) repeat protein
MPEKGARARKPKQKKAAGSAKRAGSARSAASAKAAPSSATARAGSGGSGSNGDWSDLADRAARKISELADKARPHAERAGEAVKKMAVDLGEMGGGVDGAFNRISEQARDLMAKGQHTRVRIRFRGRQLAELPIAVVAAAEVATFWWLGPLRLLLGHVVGKAVLDVEFVSNADHHVAEGRKLLADGELDKAIAEFEKALAMDRRHAGAHLGKGIALKLRGDKAKARESFEKAEEFEPRSEAGREARRHLDNL